MEGDLALEEQVVVIEDLKIFLAIVVCGALMLIVLFIYTLINRKVELKSLADMTH